MSDEVFLFFLQIVIEQNVGVDRGVKRCRLAFEFDDFYYAKASTKTIGNESKNDNKSLL